MIKFILTTGQWLVGVFNRYFGILFVYVLIGLVSGTVAFLLVLNSSYGILPSDLLFARKASAKDAHKSIALLNSNYSHSAYEKMKGNHHAQVELWATYLRESGTQVHMLGDADLERGIDGKFEALVLPGSIALSKPEMEKIRSFLRSGGGLLIEGAVGTRDGNDRWRGWDFLKELIKSDSIEVLKNQDHPFVTLTGGSPLSVRLPTGLKIKNSFYSENYGVLSEPTEAYWSEWLQSHAKQGPYLAAIKTNRYGAGRVVWFGFNLGSMSEEPEPHQAVIRLIDNTTDWITQQPLAQVPTWPHAEQAAINLTFDCESDFHNLSRVLDLPEAKPFHFTFFMLSSVAQQYPALVKQAAERGEIALHGDNHTSFSNQTYDTQLQRLAQARSALEALSHCKVVSFRPPEQKFDAATLAAMRKLGVKNLFADHLGTSSPRLEMPGKPANNLWLPFIKPEHPVIKIPRPIYDDYDLFVRDQLDAQQAADRLIEDLNRVLREGGLYALSMHTTAPWGGLNQDKIPALTALLRKLRDQRLWIATVQEAADWWSKRALIKVSATKYSDSVILLQVTNLNDQGMADLPVEVYLPQSYSKIEIQNSKVEFQTPTWGLREDGRLIVHIPSIKGGESKSYVITSGKATS